MDVSFSLFRVSYLLLKTQSKLRDKSLKSGILFFFQQLHHRPNIVLGEDVAVQDFVIEVKDPLVIRLIGLMRRTVAILVERLEDRFSVVCEINDNDLFLSS